MARPGCLQALLEPLQIVPAQVIGDGPSQAVGQPGGYVLAGPMLVAPRRLRQRLAQLLLQRRRHEWRPPIRRGVPTIVHALRALGVVALGELADPIGGIARHRRHLYGRVSLAEQPEDLPPTALIGIVRAAIASLQFSHTQMRVEMKMSGHAAILQYPQPIPYYTYPG